MKYYVILTMDVDDLNIDEVIDAVITVIYHPDGESTMDSHLQYDNNRKCSDCTLL